MQPQQLLMALEKIVLNALGKGFEATQIQVLAPLYKGIVGIDAINEHLQGVFNPEVYPAENQFVYNDTVTFLPNDKVIQLKNMPDLDVYNGDIGIIESIEQVGNGNYDILIKFNNNYVIYGKDDMNLIRHAYCISVHKAQGSEFPLVIMPVFFQYSIMLYRQLLYTGTSRAKQSLVLLGQKQALLNGVHTNRQQERLTGLAHLLQPQNELSLTPNTINEALAMNMIAEELDGATPWDFLID